MNVLIVDATGGTGRALVEAALAAGHEVTAFARRPEAVASRHERLRVAQGALPRAVCYRVRAVASLTLLPGVADLWRHDGEEDQRRCSAGIGGGDWWAIAGGLEARQGTDPGRVRGGHRLSSKAFDSSLEIRPVGHGTRSAARLRVYDAAVREALVVLWEASDRVCGKRLKPLLPTFVGALEHHGHLRLDDGVRKKSLQASEGEARRSSGHSDPHVRRLERPTYRLHGRRPRIPRRRERCRELRAHPRSHRYRDGLDGVCGARRTRGSRLSRTCERPCRFLCADSIRTTAAIHQ